MTKDTSDNQVQLSEDTQALFADLRATLSGDEPTEVLSAAADLAVGGTPEDATLVAASSELIDQKETSEFSADTQVLEADAPKGPVVIDTVNEASAADSTATYHTAPSEEPPTQFDWRTAEVPAAEAPPNPAPSAPPTPNPGPGTGPTPTSPPFSAPQTPWVGQSETNRPVHVGLLVWAGILVLLAALVFSATLIPLSNGLILMGGLMTIFGVSLLTAGITSHTRAKRQAPTTHS